MEATLQRRILAILVQQDPVDQEKGKRPKVQEIQVQVQQALKGHC